MRSFEVRVIRAISLIFQCICGFFGFLGIASGNNPSSRSIRIIIQAVIDLRSASGFADETQSFNAFLVACTVATSPQPPGPV